MAVRTPIVIPVLNVFGCFVVLPFCRFAVLPFCRIVGFADLSICCCLEWECLL
jgi:hypothetical protein